MPDYLILLIALILLGFLAVVVAWKFPQIKKYWKILAIVVPGLFLLILIIFVKTKYRNGKEKKKEEALRDTITDIKEKITEVTLETAIEVSAANSKNEAKIEELKEIKKEPSRSERLRRLASMMQ